MRTNRKFGRRRSPVNCQIQKLPRAGLIRLVLEDDHNAEKVLVCLDRVRAAMFDTVLPIPSLKQNTWSHSRKLVFEGQQSLRSRSLGELPRECSLHCEFTTLLAEQAGTCSLQSVAFILVFPEDVGGVSSTRPASKWSMREVRMLGSIRDTFCCAGLCLFGGVDHRPPGFLSNFVTRLLALLGWSFLPKQCSCTRVIDPKDLAVGKSVSNHLQVSEYVSGKLYLPSLGQQTPLGNGGLFCLLLAPFWNRHPGFLSHSTIVVLSSRPRWVRCIYVGKLAPSRGSC